ncbi:unnamed protein product [Aureobasidium mustum]|uniref:GOLD domain-containing protein n=1 Tax=Aureobasidium mustum TaxID=2773714 RepID=A0A9N8JMI7_9PEZI|nr:unnamed protein product [Aureobasidium mustum]
MHSMLFSVLAFAALLLPTQALYFYIDGPSQKCFFEELPKDTLVVGEYLLSPICLQPSNNLNSGHYTATQWNEQSRRYEANPDMGLYISVDEIFDNDHRIVSQRGNSQGRFTFSAADSGDHRICFTPTNVPSAQGWLAGGSSAGNIKLEVDMAIGETSRIESDDKHKITDIVSKVKDLNARLSDIRKEQVFQREREAEFRNMSEHTNARVVRWTLVQLAILGVTCAWQLSHLRNFFIKQKLT